MVASKALPEVFLSEFMFNSAIGNGTHCNCGWQHAGGVTHFVAAQPPSYTYIHDRKCHHCFVHV